MVTSPRVDCTASLESHCQQRRAFVSTGLMKESRCARRLFALFHAHTTSTRYSAKPPVLASLLREQTRVWMSILLIQVEGFLDGVKFFKRLMTLATGGQSNSERRIHR